MEKLAYELNSTNDKYQCESFEQRLIQAESRLSDLKNNLFNLSVLDVTETENNRLTTTDRNTETFGLTENQQQQLAEGNQMLK